MKTTSILLLFLMSVSIIGCSLKQNSIRGNTKMQKESRKIKGYNQISMHGSFQVNLVEGIEGLIKVSAEENLLPYILTDVKGDQLNIKFKSGYSYSPTKKITVTVPVEDLDEITLVGSGNVSGKIPGQLEDLKLVLTGSGNIELTIVSQNLNSSLIGSGDIELSGETAYMETMVSGSGDFKAYQLKAQEIEAMITGSGDMQLYAVQRLKARVIGSGDILYKGEPKKETINITGSGNVKAAN